MIEVYGASHPPQYMVEEYCHPATDCYMVREGPSAPELLQASEAPSFDITAAMMQEVVRQDASGRGGGLSKAEVKFRDSFCSRPPFKISSIYFSWSSNPPVDLHCNLIMIRLLPTLYALLIKL